MLLFIDIQNFKKSYSHLFQNAYAMSCLQIRFAIYIHCLSDRYVYLDSQSPSESCLWMIRHLQLNVEHFGHKAKIFICIDISPPIVNSLHY